MLVLLSAPMTTPPSNSTATRVVPVETCDYQTYFQLKLSQHDFHLFAPGKPILRDGFLAETGEVLESKWAGHLSNLAVVSARIKA